MKKILLSTVALLSLSAGAMAADLPSRRAPAPAFVAAPVFTWTGFYVGGNVGWGWSNNDSDTVVFPGAALPAGFAGGSVIVDRGNNDGILGGGQVGYNMQFGQFVLGVEADIQGADLKSDSGTLVTTTTTTGFPTGFAVTNTGRSGIDWFGTVRGRAGVAFDRFLVYGTGGFAYGGGNNNGACVAAFSGTVCGSSNDTRTGWTAGGGVSYALTNNLIVSLEGLFVSLDRDNSVVVGTDTAGRTFATTVSGGNDEFGLVRGKVDFKF